MRLHPCDKCRCEFQVDGLDHAHVYLTERGDSRHYELCRDCGKLLMAWVMRPPEARDVLP